MGIEPTYPAWKAGVLPLNYTREQKIYYHIILKIARGKLKFLRPTKIKISSGLILLCYLL